MQAYRIYNDLDDRFRPLADPSAGPLPPLYPSRVKAFVFACGEYAEEVEVKLAGGKVSNRAGG